MDRSNSLSSNTSTGSRSGSSAPFAYQTRLLERTSSRHGSGAGPLSRSNSQSNINFSPNTTSSSVGSVTPTRWSSVHRVGNSLDLVRAKWEERSREQLDDTPSSSPIKDSSKSNISNFACYRNGLHCIRSTFFGRPTPYLNEPHFSNWNNNTKISRFK